VRQKVILTLTAGEHRPSVDYTRLFTLLDSVLFGCELTARDADGTLLFDGVVDFAQSNMLPSKQSLVATIDARHLISCGSSRAMDVPVENDGTSYTSQNLLGKPVDDSIVRNLWAEDDPKIVAARQNRQNSYTGEIPPHRPCICWATGDFKWVHGCKLHPVEHMT